MKSLKIGELEAKIPLIQGGMGVGISLSGLAGAVALEGGIGVISTAQIGYKEPDWDRNPIEANLRAIKKEVKKAKEVADEFDGKLDDTLNGISDMLQLYDEYTPDILTVKDVNMSVKKIAGVRTPVLEQVEYEIKDFSLFNAPGWFLDGIQHVKEVVNIALEREFYMRKMELLDRARKKTTQKVNLYEKVQIPGFQEAIRKIKRFLEDEENLSKSAQKIVKTRKAMEDEA